MGGTRAYFFAYKMAGREILNVGLCTQATSSTSKWNQKEKERRRYIDAYIDRYMHAYIYTWIDTLYIHTHTYVDKKTENNEIN